MTFHPGCQVFEGRRINCFHVAVAVHVASGSGLLARRVHHDLLKILIRCGSSGSLDPDANSHVALDVHTTTRMMVEAVGRQGNRKRKS